jgi:hypothetical protein
MVWGGGIGGARPGYVLNPDAGPRHYPVTRRVPIGWHRDETGQWGYDSEDLQFWEAVCVQCGDTDGPAIRQSAEVQMLRGPYPSERRANRAANKHYSKISRVVNRYQKIQIRRP